MSHVCGSQPHTWVTSNILMSFDSSHEPSCDFIMSIGHEGKGGRERRREEGHELSRGRRKENKREKHTFM